MEKTILSQPVREHWNREVLLRCCRSHRSSRFHIISSKRKKNAITSGKRGAIELFLRVLDRQGIPRLLGALFVDQDGTGEVAIAVLDRHGTPRSVLACLLCEDGNLEVFIGFHRAETRHLFVITTRRPAFLALPNADAQQRNFAYGLAGEWRRFLFPALPNDDQHQRDLAYGLAEECRRILFGHDGVLEFGLQGRPLRAAAHALARPSGVFGGWRHLVIAAGIGLQAALNLDERLLPLLPAAALGVDGPLRLPQLAAAAIGLDEARLPMLPTAALGADGPPRLPPLSAAALNLGEPPSPLIPVDPGYGMFPASASNAVDDEELPKLEEGIRRRTRDKNLVKQLATHHVLPSATSNLLARIFDLMQEIEKAGYNVDDNTVTEASMTMMIEMLNHMSERARRHIMCNPVFSPIYQRHDPTLAHPTQPNNYWGMWRSFVTTVGLSVASNAILYLLSVGIRLLEQGDEGSSITKCVESPSAEPRDAWSKWVIKFIAWLAELVVAPVLLTCLVVLVRESVIDNEKHMLHYEKNGTVNVLINGLSRAFFLGIRGFPGISETDLWARLSSAIIDLLGAAFLWWMGGYWDPDIADG